MRIALSLALILALASPAAARTGAGNSQPQEALAEESQDQILLTDGTVLRGHILAEDETMVVIETASMGRVRLMRDQVANIHRAGSPYGVSVDPDRNSVLLTPTPQTLGKGAFYFRDFELFILNAGYGLTDDLNLSLGALFPVSGSWNFLALGLKYRLLDREVHGIGLALTGSHIILPDDQRISSFGVVLGVGDAHRSLNAAVDHGVDEQGDGGERIMVGGDFQISRRAKLFAEWANSQLVFTGGDDDDEFNGFITLGFRLFGDSMAFTLGGIRPVTANTGDFLALPLMMFSAHW